MKHSGIGWAALSAAAFFMMAAPGHAALIASDGFNDGDRALGTDPNDLAWFQANNSVLGVAVDNGSPGIGSGNALSVDWTAPFANMVGVFNTGSGVALSPGQQISLAADFRFTASTTQSFRLGLYNANGTNATSDANAGANTNNDPGYFYAFSTNGAAGSQTARETGTSPTITNGTDQSAFGAGIGSYSAFGNTTHHLTFTLFEAGPGTIFATTTLDGVTVGTGTDSSAVATSFNEVAFGSGSNTPLAGTDFFLDNVTVTTAPEPGSIALMGVGLLGLAAWRRRPR